MSDLRKLLEARGKTQTQLAVVLGSRSRASELLAGKRLLTKQQIALLHEAWAIPITKLFSVARQ